MNETDTRPEGKSIRELRSIVAASNARFDRIGEVWNDLTDDEQDSLVADAEAMASENEAGEA